MTRRKMSEERIINIYEKEYSQRGRDADLEDEASRRSDSHHEQKVDCPHLRVPTHGTGADPEFDMVCRRAVAFRRACDGGNKEIEKMMTEILQKYSGLGEPATRGEENDALSGKEVAEEPTPLRARLRRQCRPQGQAGYLLG